MGLESHQNFFFENVSKSIGAMPLESFDTKRGVGDILFVQRPKYFHQFTTDLWVTHGENFKKVSRTIPGYKGLQT